MKEEGTCDTRITPASTLKIAIALTGYDAGFLKSDHAPVLAYRKGDPDWRASWLSETDPDKWIAESVVWYSQRVTAALGAERSSATRMPSTSATKASRAIRRCTTA